MNKNSRNQAIQISTDIKNNLDTCKGVFELELFNGIKEKVRVLNINSNLTIDSYTCILTTFKNDTNSITTYDIYDIKSIKCSTL